jgi:tetratricopeptide (TPR) repeat protein
MEKLNELNFSREQIIEKLNNYYDNHSAGYINHNLFSDEILHVMYCGYCGIDIDENKLNDELKGWMYACKAFSMWVSGITDISNLIDKSIQLGNYFAMRTRANKFYTEGKYEEAFQLYKKSFELGNYHSCCDLADCYLSGRGVDEDKDMALYYYSQYIKLIKDGIIIKKTNKYTRIPDIIKNELLDKLEDNYITYKQYSRISNILMKFIPINGLVDIILAYR